MERLAFYPIEGRQGDPTVIPEVTGVYGFMFDDEWRYIGTDRN